MSEPSKGLPKSTPQNSDWCRECGRGWTLTPERVRTLEEALRRTANALEVARDRAVRLGNACVDLGGVDMNRGQFLALADGELAAARRALEGK